MRVIAMTLSVLLTVGGPALSGGGPAVSGEAGGGPGKVGGLAASGYRRPLTGRLHVIRGFDPPVSRYGAGHLGVDLLIAPGALVLAAGAGVVRFAGRVAGRGVVVVQHPDGISTEYEPVRAAVRAGTTVSAGTVIGRVDGDHRGCVPGRCLHWGARRGMDYLDPLGLLQALGVVRLLPWGWPVGSGPPR